MVLNFKTKLVIIHGGNLILLIFVPKIEIS